MRNQLEDLQSALNKNHCQLLEIECNNVVVDPHFSFESKLVLKDKSRTCKIYLFANKQSPSYVFEWDDCPIFKISSSNIKRQGEIIMNWVFEKSMPSTMQSQFPEIALGALAKYYENGEGIKGEFIESWNILEETYIREFSNEPNKANKDAIELIKEMRKFKFDEVLRVGTRLSVLILSRARRGIIDDNKAHISIIFLGGSRIKISSNLDGNKKSVESGVKYEGYLKEIIHKLSNEKIN